MYEVKIMINIEIKDLFECIFVYVGIMTILILIALSIKKYSKTNYNFIKK